MQIGDDRVGGEVIRHLLLVEPEILCGAGVSGVADVDYVGSSVCAEDMEGEEDINAAR